MNDKQALALVIFLVFPGIIAVAWTGYLPANNYVIAGPIVMSAFTSNYVQTIFSTSTGLGTTVTQSTVSTFTGSGSSTYIGFSTTQSTTSSAQTITTMASTTSTTMITVTASTQTTAVSTATHNPCGTGDVNTWPFSIALIRCNAFVPITPGANPTWFEWDNGINGITMPYYILFAGLITMMISAYYFYDAEDKK